MNPTISTFDDESQTHKLARKAKESPFMIGGIGGLIGIVTYGLYGLKTRKIPLSLYLIHLRVTAQGFVIGSLTVGVGYSMFMDYVYPKIQEYKLKGIQNNAENSTSQ